MMEKPNEAALNSSFEFEALKLAVNYRAAIIGEFAGYLRGHLLEVGAGIGQNTELLRQLPGVERLVSIEPDPEFCAAFRKNFPGQCLIEGTAATIDETGAWDAIVSINVLEHIFEDEIELARYFKLLLQRKGRLCLLAPARQEIYAPLDREFGHHRRYSLRDLKEKLETAGFEILHLHYFNFLGYFAWWFNFAVLKQRRFKPLAVRMFDKLIFPPCHAIERNLVRPPIGQSLIAVARAKGDNYNSGPTR